jgi:hypothetical protein
VRLRIKPIRGGDYYVDQIGCLDCCVIVQSENASLRVNAQFRRVLMRECRLQGFITHLVLEALRTDDACGQIWIAGRWCSDVISACERERLRISAYCRDFIGVGLLEIGNELGVTHCSEYGIA